MSDKLRWGLLSTAAINDWVIGPIRQTGRSEVAAVASRSTERAQTYAAEWGIPRAYGNYEALLADPEVDVIYNPLPNSLHCEWTVKAAAAGKHVLCEKPMVLNPDDLDKIEAAAADYNVTIFEAFAYLHHPQMITVRAMVKAGKLGDLQLITGCHAFYLPAEDQDNIRLNPALGGGALWDVGIYPVSQSIILAGAGLPVEVWGCQMKGESGVDLVMSGQMRFSNGVISQISGSMRTPQRYGLEVNGSEGSLLIPNPSIRPGSEGEIQRMILSTRDGSTETIVTPAKDAYQCEIEMMESCLLDGGAPMMTFDLSRTILRSLLALYESAETGKLVTP